MANLMEIMGICRLCLVKEEVNVPIFEEQGDVRQIFLKISAILPVKVSREDNLPKKICDACLYKLESFYQFWNTTTNAEKQLITWLSNAGINVNKIDTDTARSSVILKEEPNADPDSLSNDTQNYILQQQQLPYQPEDFNFSSEDQAISNTTPNSDDQPRVKRPRRSVKKPIIEDSQDEAEDQPVTAVTKTEDESGDDGDMDTAFDDVGDDDQTEEQPGPSGIGKLSSEAPSSSATTFAKYQTRYGLKECSVLLGDLEKYDLRNYTFHKPDPNRLCNVRPDNILNSPRAKYKCQECDMKFKDYIALESHRESEHASDIEEEEKTKSSDDNYSPSEEEQSESDDDGVEELPIPPKEDFSCEACQTKFKTQQGYQAHVTKFLCKICCMKCLETFKTKALLFEHMMKSHDMYICEQCPQTFYSQRNLEIHVHCRHSGNKWKWYCRKCNMCFQETDEIKLHNLSAHGPVVNVNNLTSFSVMLNSPKTHKCQLCTNSYFNEGDLRRHMSAIHVRSIVRATPPHTINVQNDDPAKPTSHNSTRLLPGVMPEYKCTLCNKQYTTEDKLNSHLKEHIFVHSKSKILNKIPALKRKIATDPRVVKINADTDLPKVPDIQGKEASTGQSLLKPNSLKTKRVLKLSAQQTSIPNTLPTNATPLDTSAKLLLLADNRCMVVPSGVSVIQDGNIVKLVNNMQSTSTLSLQSGPTLNLQSGPTLSLQSGPTLSLQAGSTFNLQAAPTLNLQSTPAFLQSAPTLSLQSAPTLNLQSAPTLNLQSAPTLNLQSAPTLNLQTAPTLNLQSAPTLNIQPSISNLSFVTPVSNASSTINQTILLPTNIETQPQISITNQTYNPSVSQEFKQPATNIIISTPFGTTNNNSTVDTDNSDVNDEQSTDLVINTEEEIVEEKSDEPESLPPSKTDDDDEDKKKEGPKEVMDSKPEASNEPKVFLKLKPINQLLQKPNIAMESTSEEVQLIEDDDECKSPSNEVEEEEDSPAAVETTGRKLFTCVTCKVDCKRAGKYRQHLSKYKCKLCLFVCCKLKALSNHYEVIHNQKNKCASCDLQFPTVAEFQVHKVQVHLCTKCNKSYLDLEKHSTEFKCQHCGVSACNSKNLNAHYKFTHNIHARCHPCNSVFYSNEEFNEHKQTFHYCSNCKRFKMDLNIHKTLCVGSNKFDDYKSGDDEEGS